MADARVKPEPKAAAQFVDPWTTDKAEWEYITMPKKDVLGKAYATVTINGTRFEPGTKYHVPSAIAEEIRNIMEGYDRYTRRLLSNDLDVDALNTIARNSARA